MFWRQKQQNLVTGWDRMEMICEHIKHTCYLSCQKLGLSAPVPNRIMKTRVLGKVKKNRLIVLPSKGGCSRLLLLKTMCPNLGGFDEEFCGRSSRVGLLTKLGYMQGLHSFTFIQSLLILRSFSGPFNLASGGFLAILLLISNCSNLSFGTQGRPWRLGRCL